MEDGDEKVVMSCEAPDIDEDLDARMAEAERERQEYRRKHLERMTVDVFFSLCFLVNLGGSIYLFADESCLAYGAVLLGTIGLSAYWFMWLYDKYGPAWPDPYPRPRRIETQQRNP